MNNTKMYSYDEVRHILQNVYDYYDILSTDKFIMNNCNRCSDSPSDDYVMKKMDDEIESFIIY